MNISVRVSLRRVGAEVVRCDNVVDVVSTQVRHEADWVADLAALDHRRCIIGTSPQVREPDHSIERGESFAEGQLNGL